MLQEWKMCTRWKWKILYSAKKQRRLCHINFKLTAHERLQFLYDRAEEFAVHEMARSEGIDGARVIGCWHAP